MTSLHNEVIRTDDVMTKNGSSILVKTYFQQLAHRADLDELHLFELHPRFLYGARHLEFDNRHSNALM